jgi:hypothetical protein
MIIVDSPPRDHFLVFLFCFKLTIMKYLLLIGTLFFLSTSTVEAKKIKDIQIKHHADITGVRYGSSFKMEIMVVYSNDKKKKVRDSHGKLTVEVIGGSYSGSYVTVNGHPKTLDFNGVVVKAKLVTENGKTFSKKLTVPLTFKGEMYLNYSGANGDDGAKGDDRGTPLLFRDGTNGDEGGAGQMGSPGHDILVWVWKAEKNYVIKVTDTTTAQTYWYQKEDIHSDLIIDVTGGNGGNGGPGGDGGDGKDGKITENKNKDPGDGGSGGNGGVGGDGGIGGNALILIHSSAKDLHPKIVLKNYGGNPGMAGAAGKGGDPGSPKEGQDDAAAGIAGIEGIAGQPGSTGVSFEIKEEDFSIEEIGKN